MPCPFDITAATNSVRLDAKRQGQATFTVFNRSGRPVRGRAQLAPQDPSIAGWLTLAGDVERNFAIAATEQYTVTVAAPPDAQAGSYSFRLDMVGVENPDEDYCSGPSVSFEAPEVEPSKPFPWWIVAAVVAVVVVIGVAAYFIWPRSVAVPSLQGLAVNDARATLEANRLAEGNLLEGEGEGVEPGNVVASTPAPGEKVARNSPVDLVIAAAPTETPTPSLTPTPTTDLAATATAVANATATAVAQAIGKYTGSWEVVDEASPYITKLTIGRDGQTATLSVAGYSYVILTNGGLASAYCFRLSRDDVRPREECAWGSATTDYSGDPLIFTIKASTGLTHRITVTWVDASTLSAFYRVQADQATLPDMSFVFKRARSDFALDSIVAPSAAEAVFDNFIYLTPVPVETLESPSFNFNFVNPVAPNLFLVTPVPGGN